MKSSPSVLIVDDEAIMAFALKKRLSARGISICGTAATGEEAIEKAGADRPEYILMDIRLAGEMDGIEAARQITQMIPTKIIFISGYSEGEIKKRAMDVHPLAYLVKPFDLSELLTYFNSN